MPSYKEAIVVRNATKKYGKNKPILDGLNLSVAKGSIYGLLGASGSGKTTLLSCIVGIRALDNGEIWVHGGNPGSKTSSIPGPGVGFMPQEISLVNEFTVMGALNYFGRINGLDTQIINERYEFLSKLLQLPSKNQFVKNMSGGQQRRVSLACAIIHQPELLILDEPTVGLDPILRENIWNFLVTLAKQRGVTIIITTHYIDEAKLANKIGLLRHGKLLAEESPSKLLAKYRCDSLEAVFLHLSQMQKDSEDNNVSQQINVGNNGEYLPELEEITHPSIASTTTTTGSSEVLDQNYNVSFNITRRNKTAPWMNNSKHHSIKHRRFRRFQALMIKNFLQFIRHPIGIIFAFILPLLQVNIFFNAIGQDPQGLIMAIVNEEAGNCQSGTYIGEVIYSFEDDYVCDFVNLSCRFLDDFHHKVAKNRFYNNENDALNSVKRGETVGLMHFGQNFSHSLQERLEIFNVDDISNGQIQIRLDMGNQPIALYLENNLYKRFFHTYSTILQKCKLPKKLSDLPLRLEEPIFGSNDEKYSTFMAPTFVLTLMFFMATSVSSSIIIADRSEGVWNRSLVQGVTTTEILISHLITQMTVIIIQAAITSVVTFLQYNLECRGSLITTVILILLTGVCGMCYGFLVSVLCTSHTIANYMTTGSFYPVILLCGCVWPIEGMPRILRWLSLTLPTTIPGLAMRNIIKKGYTIDDPQVFQGFLIIVGWIIFFVILCLVGLKKKKS
ncbi:hypothetical protein PV325_013694 [Microctonus aethiopoides]|uniref:Uncharacterized protein n=1 Tax=Microctonus aethiopoides TaxID=144406 RepID=A0AA39F8W1_9HYME|nr:hypothetical protein PV325_013694 [Microctonus aethiopoides]KAK0165119.1 hypothetical protein PV328_003669 [Microctonus aethiopoides]